MKTTNIVKKDILFVAAGLKMDVSDELVEQVLNEYEGYRTQYPEDNWREIVETMLYDFTGPVLRYTGTHDQLGYEQTHPEPGDDDYDVNMGGQIV